MTKQKIKLNFYDNVSAIGRAIIWVRVHCVGNFAAESMRTPFQDPNQFFFTFVPLLLRWQHLFSSSMPSHAKKSTSETFHSMHEKYMCFYKINYGK